MAVELRPFGVACNIACRYCYQNPQREAGNVRQAYDLERMKTAVEREGGSFTLFGGEPLLMPLAHLEELFRWGKEQYGSSAIQTNGILIGDEHMRLFRTYNVEVGISIDGPDELNDLRWHGSPERTRESTAKTLANIGRLCREHRPPGLIITLHRGNAAADRLPRLQEWVRRLDGTGIRSIRLHLLEVESEAIREAYSLTDEENVQALLSFADLQQELKEIRFDVLEEMEQGLMGEERRTSCVWHACDPYTTPAVRGVEGNGQTSNCGRTNKDGVDYLKADQSGFERYLALYSTPQADGGCQGCRFFLTCKGQCPGTAIGGDWRNRSELCEVWKRLFEHLEQRLIARGEVPQSVHPKRLQWEQELIEYWTERSSFQRVAFVGAAQRDVWEPRLEAVRTALARVGVLAVAQGLAPVAVVAAAPEEVLPLHNLAAEQGLHTRLLSKSRHERHHRVVVGAEEAVDAYEQAVAVGDRMALDELVGMPSCCREAHQRWRDMGGMDPLLAVAHGPACQNTLLRVVGLDLLGYQPCSLDCAESQALAAARVALGREAGLTEAMDWLEQMLDWPAEWTALHGIAEGKTAIFRFLSKTDYTAGLVKIRYQGRALAPEAARGLTFVHQRPPGRPWAKAVAAMVGNGERL